MYSSLRIPHAASLPRAGTDSSSHSMAGLGMYAHPHPSQQHQHQHRGNDGARGDYRGAPQPSVLQAPMGEEGDEDSSANSDDSYTSYDGKCTGAHAIRAQTHEQELMCHELNAAICDVYGAPVKRTLLRYPLATRLIRSEDASGNTQLHYAVRHGNVKAVRHILRADLRCALIRNTHGYCALHFAVEIGNFAAVQLLCSMAPASAKVQCEEGCLPLHEAVSSAAHHPDAPQITTALLNAFPAAVRITNDEGLLPLHLAAMSGFSAGIRTIFANGFGTIYARENTEQMLPLDFAVDGYFNAREEASNGSGGGRTRGAADEERDATMRYDAAEARRPPSQPQPASGSGMSEKEVEFKHCIDSLLMSALYDRPVLPSVRSGQMGLMFLPVHGAATSQPCIGTWKRILSMYGEEYMCDVDVRGRTALHVLLSSRLSDPAVGVRVAEMVKDLYGLDPDAMNTFDDSGFVPLHTALINAASYSIIKSIVICSNRSILSSVDEDCDRVLFRGMLPFQLAAACDGGVEVIYLLLREHPTGI